MQIIDRGRGDDNGGEYADADKEKDKFVDGNIVCTRYAETNIATRELAAFNIPMEEYMDASQLYAYLSCRIPLCEDRHLFSWYIHRNGLCLVVLLRQYGRTSRMAFGIALPA